MHVFKIECREYEYRLSVSSYGYSDYVLSHTLQKHVMADNTLDAVRSNVRRRIDDLIARNAVLL
jgi:hypothetical protein